MTGYLANLVERTLVADPVVKPRFRSRFEPPAPSPMTEAIADHVEHDAARSSVKPGLRSVASQSVGEHGREDVQRESLAEWRETKEKWPSMTKAGPGRQLTGGDDVFRSEPVEEPTLLPQPERARELDTPTLVTWESESDSELVRRPSPDGGSSEDQEVAAHGDRQVLRSTPPRAPSSRTAWPVQFAQAATPEPRSRATRPHTIRSSETAVPAVSLLGRDSGPGRNSDAPPSVRVSIGRVDVRAHFTPAPAPTRRRDAPKPRLSLEDYLKSRSGGSR